jgi:hypothetical protein
MLHAGLDLSRKKVDDCLLSAGREIVDEWRRRPERSGACVHFHRAPVGAPVLLGRGGESVGFT